MVHAVDPNGAIFGWFGFQFNWMAHMDDSIGWFIWSQWWVNMVDSPGSISWFKWLLQRVGVCGWFNWLVHVVGRFVHVVDTNSIDWCDWLVHVDDPN